MANNLAQWTPPESETTNAIIKWGGVAALALGGLYAFTRVAPTMVDAINLLDTLMQDTTHMVVSGVILVGTLWLARETLSSTGSINHLIRLPYWMIVNGLTRLLFTIDPLSPITERIKQVRADQATFEAQFEKLDGLINVLTDKEQECRGMAAKVQRIGVAADKQGASQAKSLAAYKFGANKDAADSYAAMRARLEPVRAQFQQISQSCDFTAQKLEIDAGLLRDKWAMQQALNKAVDSAGRILGRSKTQVWSDAEEAADIVNTKYSEELGHLDHLKKYAEPLMQSIDLETASYSEEMLQQVQSAGSKVIASAGAPLQLPPAQQLAGGSASDLSALIR